jgi:hypothetical protein
MFIWLNVRENTRKVILSMLPQSTLKNESIVFNLVYERDGFYYYSIVRADGFNIQEQAKAKLKDMKAGQLVLNKNLMNTIKISRFS